MIKLNMIKMVKMKDLRGENYPLLNYQKTSISNNEKKKILIIGDSYIEGDGYTNINQTWWRVLQLKLYEKGYYDTEIYAVGKNGASTYDEMNWLTNTTMIDDINPDLIIIGYVFNDPEIDDENGINYVKDFETIEYFEKNNFTKLYNNAYANISYKIDNMLNEKYKAINNVEDRYNIIINDKYKAINNVEDRYDIIINDKWSKIYNEKAVIPLGEYLNSIDIPSFVVTTPNTTNDKAKERYKILNLFEDANINVYNMIDELKQKKESNVKYLENTKINLVNSHPGTFYTNFYANYVVNILEQDYIDIIGKKYEEKIKYPIKINDYVPYSLSLELLKEKNKYVTYSIDYPSNNKSDMLYMPIKKEYVKLSFEFHVDISKIEISGNNLKNCKLYLNKIDNELNYDNQKMYGLKRKNGNTVIWNTKDYNNITSVNISAQTIDNNGDNLKIKFYK